jgi:hypothetical protein
MEDDKFFVVNMSMKLNQGKFISSMSKKTIVRNAGRKVREICSAFRGALALQTGIVALFLATEMHCNTKFDRKILTVLGEKNFKM